MRTVASFHASIMSAVPTDMVSEFWRYRTLDLVRMRGEYAPATSLLGTLEQHSWSPKTPPGQMWMHTGCRKLNCWPAASMLLYVEPELLAGTAYLDR